MENTESVLKRCCDVDRAKCKLKLDETAIQLSSDSGSRITKMKPPCKKKYQEASDEIFAKINEVKNEMKTLQFSNSIEKDDHVKHCKEQRSLISQKRKEICDEIDILNKQSCAKKASLFKLQHNIQYKSEVHINNAISKLEYQLTTNNFRASEERKIVSEIDSLKRSKKALGEYLTLKEELNVMKQRLAFLRKEKDKIFCSIQKIKTQEEAMRTQEAVKNNKIEELKKHMDDLYIEKRELMAKHKKDVAEFEVYKELRNKEMIKKREEEYKAIQTAKMKEMEEEKLSFKPYQKEKLLCEMLISYLNRFESTPSSTPSEHSFTFGSANTTPVGVMKELENGETVYILKKKELEEFPCFPRKGKREKRHNSSKRTLNHAPDVYKQFLTLDVKAPTSSKEIPSTVEQLKVKKKYFSNMVERSQLNHQSDTPNVSEALGNCCTISKDNDFVQSDVCSTLDDLNKCSSDSEQTSAVNHNEKSHLQNFILNLRNCDLVNGMNLLSEDIANANIDDDGYSESSINDSANEFSSLPNNKNVPQVITSKPSETCCSNSSDTDSALPEEIKSLESPEIVFSENKFQNWNVC